MKKHKLKNIPNIIKILSILVITILSAFLIYTKTNNYKLTKIGYKAKEIKQIISLNKKDIAFLLNNKYNKNIYELIKDKNFNKDKFKQYINYLTTYKTEIDDTVFIINNKLDTYKDFNPLKIDNYKLYIRETKLNIETIITLINNNIDYNNTISNIINEKYYKETNLLRYLKYTKASDASIIVRDVNSNLDYEYYTNVKKTDMSKNNLIIVNKYYKLANDYEPSDLTSLGSGDYATKDTATAYKKMTDAAAHDNCFFKINSAYRSYNTQNSLYTDYQKNHGINWADNYSARPGYSEHQTGLALDITSNSSNFDSFPNTKEFKWLQTNAYKYGFILRYPENLENVTGYHYESWHYRYVGNDVANKIYNEKITYEEYYEYYVNK